MAVEYEFKRKRNHSYSASGSVGGGAAIRYSDPLQCITKDDDDPGFDGTGVTRHDILNLLGETGAHCWDDRDWAGTPPTVCNPWTILSDKRVSRHPTNAKLWEIELGYSGGPFQAITESFLLETSVEASLADYGAIYEDAWTEQNEVLYIDKSTPPVPCRLPTGTLYTDPFQERIPARQFRVTQFEDSLTENTIAQRLFSVNSDDFLGRPPGFWLVSDMQYQRCVLPTTGNPNTAGYRVTYVLRLNSVREWWDRRALIDMYYFEGTGSDRKRKEFTSTTRTSFVEGLIDENGAAKADQTGEPDYKTYKDLDEVSFAFIRTAINTVP